MPLSSTSAGLVVMGKKQSNTSALPSAVERHSSSGSELSDEAKNERRKACVLGGARAVRGDWVGIRAPCVPPLFAREAACRAARGWISNGASRLKMASIRERASDRAREVAEEIGDLLV
eukprot:scaffold228180_cov41-Tisochrysis_lutea.AAC.2